MESAFSEVDEADAKPLPSLIDGYTRRSRWTACLVGLTFTIITCVAGGSHVNRIARRGIIREAQVCAAVLEPDRDGALDGAVNRLRSQYPALAAVATLDVRGNLASLYPDRQSYARALQPALPEPGEPVRTSALHEGSARPAWAIAIPLGGVEDPSARTVALLLWDDAGGVAWPLLAGIALAAMVVATVASETLIGWVEQQFIQPIRRLRLSPETARATCRSAMRESINWRELEEINGQFRRLVLDSRRVEREAQQQIGNDRKRFDRKLRRAEDLAMTDVLTGLHNRIFIESELEALFRRQRNKGEDLSAVMIDLDNFKYYNDTNGHGAGDDMLRVAGELLRAAIRPTDYAIRFGGDEFVLLLPGADRDEAGRIAERIIKLFQQRVRVIRSPQPISMSAGVASLKHDQAESGLDLLHTADVALYSVKRNGKNAVSFGLT